jgi:KDO2-lipid IV(A) lauroyltransferase
VKFLGYILVRSIIWMLHLLPERILYLISDLVYVGVYYLAAYRKKVVTENLTRSFPEMNRMEVRRIARKFYHHLCDVILESAVSHFYSEEQFRKRITYLNTDLLDKLYAKQKPVIAVAAHYGNWEYLTTLSLVSEYTVFGAYKPLKNKYFDRLIQKSRNRFRSLAVPMDQVVRKVIGMARDGQPAISVFISDQRPVFQNIQYWTRFLGQDTPLFLGAEKLARKLNAAVIFLKVRKVKRGRYEVDIELITDEPAGWKTYELTEAHVRILEDLIREAPEYWLWSHRRWKHSLERYRRETERSSAI